MASLTLLCWREEILNLLWISPLLFAFPLFISFSTLEEEPWSISQPPVDHLNDMAARMACIKPQPHDGSSIDSGYAALQPARKLI